MSLSLSVIDDASPLIAQLSAGLSDRTKLHEAIAERALNLTRDWLAAISRDRHDTAERLGASPSHFWQPAAEGVSAFSDSDGASVTVRSPGIGRAAHDVTITAQSSRFLTIPLIAEAYNQRARAIWESQHLFIPGGKEHPRRVIASRNEDGTLKLWYALVESVTQRQDRTLLPSDEAYSLACLQGARDHVGFLMGNAR